MAASVALALLALPGAASAAPTQSLVLKITSGPEGTISNPDVSFTFDAEGATDPQDTVYACALDKPPTQLSKCISPFSAGPLAPGLHSFWVQATNLTDMTYSQVVSRTFTIASAATAPSEVAPIIGPGPLVTTPVRPLLSGLAQSAPRWREGNALAKLSSASQPPRGTTFSFSLNEAATVGLTFKQTTAGRSVGGRCVAQSAGNRARARLPPHDDRGRAEPERPLRQQPGALRRPPVGRQEAEARPLHARAERLRLRPRSGAPLAGVHDRRLSAIVA